MEIVLNVSGMTCGGCSQSVNRVLSDIQGVDSVEVNWQQGQVRVVFDETQCSVQQLETAIDDAGFDVLK